MTNEWTMDHSFLQDALIRAVEHMSMSRLPGVGRATQSGTVVISDAGQEFLCDREALMFAAAVLHPSEFDANARSHGGMRLKSKGTDKRGRASLGRDNEIGQLLADGMSIRAIATQLGISKGAVQNAKARIGQ